MAEKNNQKGGQGWAAGHTPGMHAGGGFSWSAGAARMVKMAEIQSFDLTRSGEAAILTRF